MTNIERLILDLCPNGVEFKKLGEVCDINRGVRIVKSELSEGGDYPVYQNSLTPLGYYDKCNYPANTAFIISAGAAGKVGYSDVDFWAADDCLCITCPDYLLSKFLYYCMTNKQDYFLSQVRHASVPRMSRNIVENFEIPLPPLEIQQKIVEILDNFSALAAELQAELQKRRTQYEYYRTRLLTPPPTENISSNDSTDDSTWTWTTLGEISTKIVSGGTPARNRAEYFEGAIPWMRTQEVDWCEVYDTEIHITEEAVKNSSAKLIPANCVVIAMYGATAGKSCINKIPLTTNQACCNLEIDPKRALYKYVYYWVCKEYENIKGMGEGSQNNINGQKIKSYKIPLPSLKEQARIVAILDKFEALTTSLTEGIPAEQAAQQKRYEYFRNLLLTFDKK